MLNLHIDNIRFHVMKKFKHLLVVALVALFAVGQANAEFRFGVKAGANFSSLHLNSNWTDTFKADNTAGFTGGVMTEFTVPIIGIGMDLSLMYTHVKNELTSKDGQKFEEGTIGKNFLEIPLNLKYKINIPVVNNIARPMIFTGPTFAFKLDKSIFKDVKTKTCQIGWNLGLGVEFFKHLQVAGGYTFGMNNILKNTIPGLGSINDVKLKNNYWTVTAAYLF